MQYMREYCSLKDHDYCTTVWKQERHYINGITIIYITLYIYCNMANSLTNRGLLMLQYIADYSYLHTTLQSIMISVARCDNHHNQQDRHYIIHIAYIVFY